MFHGESQMCHGAPKYSTETLKCFTEVEMFHGECQMFHGPPKYSTLENLRVSVEHLAPPWNICQLPCNI